MRRLLKFCFLGIFFLCPYALLVVNGQDKVRTVNDAKRNFRNPPIAIIGRETGGKIFDGKYAVAGPEWLKDLVLTVKNVSTKDIKDISIIVRIPKQGAMEHPVVFYYSFPQLERIFDENGRLSYAPAVLQKLKPGATTKLKAWDHQLKIIDDIREQGVVDVGEVEIDIQHVIFDDGTGWLMGLPAIEDANRPGSLVISKAGVSGQMGSWCIESLGSVRIIGVSHAILQFATASCSFLLVPRTLS